MAASLASLLRERTKDDTLQMMSDALEGRYPIYKDGLGSGELALAGGPTSAARVRIEVTTEGALSTARIRYSLDAGATWAASDVLVPASGEVPLGSTGILLRFTPGQTPTNPVFSVGDSFTFEIVTPTFQVRSWQPYDTAMTLLEVLAVGLASLWRLVVRAIAGGFGRLASDEWIDIWAREFYDETRREGLKAQHRVVLTDTLSSGPFTITPGQFWVVSSTGQRFVAASGGVVPLGGALTLLVDAERSGSDYNVGIGSIRSLVTTLPGVTVNNPDIGSGTSLVRQGTNRETREELYQRCRLKWTTLSAIPTDGLFEYWAKQASPQVTRVRVYRSPTVPGEILIALAGPSGGVPQEVADTVAAALQAKTEALTTVVVAQPAINRVIDLTYELEVLPDMMTSAPAAAEARLLRYLQSVRLGGIVRDGPIIGALKGGPDVPGVVDVELEWTGDIQLATSEVAVPGVFTVTVTPAEE